MPVRPTCGASLQSEFSLKKNSNMFTKKNLSISKDKAINDESTGQNGTHVLK